MQKKTYSVPSIQVVKLHLEGAVTLLSGGAQQDPGFASGRSESLERHDELWDDFKKE